MPDSRPAPPRPRPRSCGRPSSALALVRLVTARRPAAVEAAPDPTRHLGQGARS